MVYERRVRSCRSASRTSPNSAPRVKITADEITRHPRWATSPLSEVQINCEQHSRSPGAQCPEASLATRLRYARELHLVINPDRADHTLVIWVHQRDAGEKCSAPGTDTTRGLSSIAEGRLTPSSSSAPLLPFLYRHASRCLILGRIAPLGEGGD